MDEYCKLVDSNSCLLFYLFCVQAKMDVCKVTEIYQNEARNKPAISMTVRRAHFEDENKSPDWPGQS